MHNIMIESPIGLGAEERERVLDEVIAVEQSAWPRELRGSREKFISRLNVFPKGFIVARVNGVIKGVSTSQITTYDTERLSSWDDFTDRGFIKSTHDSSGNALYVVSLGISQDTQRLGLGSKLLDAQKALAQELNKKYVFLGARVPAYDEYCKNNGEIDIKDYLSLKNEKGEPRDPEIRFYSRRGFQVSKIVLNFEPDPASRNYGLIMVWKNK